MKKPPFAHGLETHARCILIPFIFAARWKMQFHEALEEGTADPSRSLRF